MKRCNCPQCDPVTCDCPAACEMDERDALQKTVLRLMDQKLAEQAAHTETARLLYQTTAERDALKALNLQLVTDLHRENTPI